MKPNLCWLGEGGGGGTVGSLVEFRPDCTRVFLKIDAFLYEVWSFCSHVNCDLRRETVNYGNDGADTHIHPLIGSHQHF